MLGSHWLSLDWRGLSLDWCGLSLDLRGLSLDGTWTAYIICWTVSRLFVLHRLHRNRFIIGFTGHALLRLLIVERFLILLLAVLGIQILLRLRRDVSGTG